MNQMAIANRDIEEVYDVLRLHLSSIPKAGRLINDLCDTHAARFNQSFRETLQRLKAEHERRTV